MDTHITVSISAEKYFHIVVDGLLENACKELEKLFHVRWKKEMKEDWTGSAEQLERLNKKLVKFTKFEDQKEYLEKGYIHKWDITLTCKVLTKMWSHYKEENAAILELKSIRDKLAHLREKVLDQDTYNENMEVIESSLNVIRVKSNVIKEMVKKAQATLSKGENNALCSRPEDITDSTTWNELSDALKTVMGTKNIFYQGKKVKLSHFLDYYFTLLPPIFPDGSLLVELAKGNIPTLVNNQVPEHVSYYISRTITGRRRLDEKVFRNKIQDVFVVQGLAKHQLTFLVEGDMDFSGNQILKKNLTVRFIFLEHENDFEKICKLSSAPVHWIRHNDNAYEWVKSSRSVKNLQQFVLEKQDSYEEMQLGVGSLSNDKIVVISDSPGMGKTTLLSNMAREMLIKHDDIVLIRFLVLKEFVQAITMKQKPINLGTVIELIAEQSSDFLFGRSLIQHELTKPCILMFDGFDEVFTHQTNTAKQILEAVSTLKSARVFVTTRPHMREELENTLHVFGYTIQPFAEEEQINFVLNFWKKKNVTINESVEQFAKSCLAALTTNFTDFEREIAGIPLQCRLFAEANADHAERCSELGFQAYENFNPCTSLFEMYEKHFEMRFQKLCTNRSWLGWVKSEYDLIKEAHIYHALELLFPEHKDQLLLSSSTNDIYRHGILEVSSSNDIRFVHTTFAEFLVAWFVAENYVSRQASSFILSQVFSTTPKNEKILNTPPQKELFEHHVKKILPYSTISSFNFSFPVICHFINGFLENSSTTTGTETNSLPLDKQILPIFFASAYHNYSKLPLVVNEIFSNRHSSSQTLFAKIQNWYSEVIYGLQPSQTPSLDIPVSKYNLPNLLLITAKYSDVDLISYFYPGKDMEAGAKGIVVPVCENSEGSYLLTPLHLAAQRGRYELVAHLVKKFLCWLPEIRYLIHFCVFDSLRDNKATIEDKKQIIELLMKTSKQWINEKLPNGATPLILPSVNVELVECLIKAGADVNVLSKTKSSVLLNLSDQSLLPETYHDILLVLNEHRFKHFTSSNTAGVTPLHWALTEMELLPKTLNFFSSKGAHFNADNNSSDSILYYAIRGGRSVTLIRMLIEKGARCQGVVSTCLGETVIHACVKYSHYEALEFFLNDYEMNLDTKVSDRSTYDLITYALSGMGVGVNATNQQPETPFFSPEVRSYGETALHMAVIDRSEVKESIIQLLIEKGAGVNVNNKQNETPFIKAFARCKGLSLSTIKLMEKHRLQITKELASEALLGFFTNSHIFPWELDKELLEAMEYLMYKKNGIIDSYCCRFLDIRQELAWSPWKLKDVQKSMNAVIQATTVNADLLAKAEQCGLLTKKEIADIHDLTPNTLKCKQFYEILQEKPGSFERLCMILISSNQTHPFAILKRCLNDRRMQNTSEILRNQGEIGMAFIF